MAKPTALGSQANPSHSALHNFHVDVKMFGATGDGSTDDTSAIQSAITTVQGAGGGTVYFPPTSSFYKVTGSDGLTIRASGVALLGAGYGSRIHNPGLTSRCVMVGDVEPGDTAQYSGIAIANLRFTQNVTSAHSDDGFGAIYARSPYAMTVRDCWFEDCAQAIQIQKRNANDAHPENCIIANNHIKRTSANTTMGIEIFVNKGTVCTGNNIVSTTTAGLGIRCTGLDNLVEGNFIRGGNLGITLQGAGTLRQHIIGNRVIGVGGSSATAIQLTNDIVDSVIQDNYLDDFVYGVWCKSAAGGGTDRVVIRGNYLRTAAATTHAIFIDPPATGDNDSVTILDNHIEAALGGNGIYLDTVAGRNLILGNTLRMSSGVNEIQHANMPAGSETVSRRNTIIGSNIAPDVANFGSGSGKFINYNHNGIDDNIYWDSNSADKPESIWTPAQITADQNDYDPQIGFVSGRHISTWRISSDAARNITGIAGGWSGRRLTLINVGGFTITLTNQDVLSVAANRIISGIAAPNIALAPDDSATLIYDDTTARWRAVNTQIAGG